MPSDPYRVASSSSEELTPESSLFEQRCVAVVLALAGAIGVAIGCSAPHEHATELVLGVLLVVLGVRTVERSAGAGRTRSSSMTRRAHPAPFVGVHRP